MRYYLLFFRVFLIPLTHFVNDASAQSATYPIYEVAHLPAKLKYKKETLSAELKNIKTLENLKKAIISKNFAPSTIVIKCIKDAKSYSWLTLNIGLKTITEDDHILLQSRNTSSVNIYKLSDFKNLLKDTLVLMDSLFFNLYLHDENYPNENFEITTICNNKNQKTERLSVVNGKLILCKSTVVDCNDTPALFSLFNSKNSGRQLATGKIIFLTDEIVQLLEDLNDEILASSPEADIKEIAANLEAYIYNNRIGKLYYPQLISWLKETNRK